MNSKKIGLIALIAGAIIALLFYSGYNSFVKLDEEVKVKWNEIQNTYQRRNDLIPSLVNVVKGSTDYEQNVLRQLTEARAQAGRTNTSVISHDTYQQQEAAQGNVTNNMNKIIAVVENYPNLQSTKEFTTLQSQLEGTERRIKFARKDFNAAVMDYNKKVRSFPWNIVGSVLGFKVKEGFTADAGTQNAPEVKFNK
ncbi:MAG: LemA family protein [Chitinophagaceae bacterium]